MRRGRRQLCGRELGTEGAPDAPTPEGALQESGARRIQEQIASRVAALEERSEEQGRIIEKLRTNRGLRDDPAAVVARIKEEFGKLEHVIRINYDILRDGTWHVVVVHDLDDENDALHAVCEKAMSTRRVRRRVSCSSSAGPKVRACRAHSKHQPDLSKKQIGVKLRPGQPRRQGAAALDLCGAQSRSDGHSRIYKHGREAQDGGFG